jgi:hypothetical protein
MKEENLKELEKIGVLKLHRVGKENRIFKCETV